MQLTNIQKSSLIVKQEDMHKPIARSLYTLDGQSDMQFENIFEQLEVLKRQYLEIEEKKRISKKIYDSELKFDPIILGIYYLYIRNRNEQFISMVGPNEWGRSRKSHLEYIAQIRLQYDHTWEILHLNNQKYLYEEK
jgi:hypothetical protein